jgi:hypothetical protein
MATVALNYGDSSGSNSWCLGHALQRDLRLYFPGPSSRSRPDGEAWDGAIRPNLVHS